MSIKKYLEDDKTDYSHKAVKSKREIKTFK